MIQKVLRKEYSRIFCKFVFLESQNFEAKSSTYAVNDFWRYLHILLSHTNGKNSQMYKLEKIDFDYVVAYF